MLPITQPTPYCILRVGMSQTPFPMAWRGKLYASSWISVGLNSDLGVSVDYGRRSVGRLVVLNSRDQLSVVMWCYWSFVTAESAVEPEIRWCRPSHVRAKPEQVSDHHRMLMICTTAQRQSCEDMRCAKNVSIPSWPKYLNACSSGLVKSYKSAIAHLAPILVIILFQVYPRDNEIIYQLGNEVINSTAYPELRCFDLSFGAISYASKNPVLINQASKSRISSPPMCQDRDGPGRAHF